MLKIENAFLIDICLGIPLGKVWSPANIPQVAEHEILPTYLLRGDQLAAFKKLYTGNDSFALRAVEGISTKADTFLSCTNPSVVQKTEAFPGAKQNDYISLAKYWWPRDKFTDGKQYVMRDGEVNPECYSDRYDLLRLDSFTEATLLLAIAAYLTGKKIYAEKANSMIKTWFIDPATRQTPHFKFAQIVPGKEGQRFQGIIEARRLIYVCEALQILTAINAIEKTEIMQCKAWFSELLKWLQSSEQGQAAGAAKNNISFWYDLQRLVFSRFTGQERLSEKIIRDYVPAKLEEQTDEEGRLVNELNRARPYDYVAFTLMALAELEAASKYKEIGLADFSTAEGKNFENVYNWFNETIHANKLDETSLALGRLISMQRLLSTFEKENQALKMILKEKENNFQPDAAKNPPGDDLENNSFDHDKEFKHVISNAGDRALQERVVFAEREADRLRNELGDVLRDVLMIALRYRGVEKMLLEKKIKKTSYDLKQENEMLRQQIKEYKFKYNKVINSRLWRYSSPFRKILGYFRGN